MTTTILHRTACNLLRACFDRRRFLHLAASAGMLAAFPSLALATEGHHDAMLQTCIDPRFQEPNFNYMKGRSMAGKYSPFTFAGATVGVVASAFKT